MNEEIINNTKKCLKQFLCFTWLKHDFEAVDIKEDVKIIGEKFGEYETGIFIRRFITTTEYKCKNCGLLESKQEQKEEMVRQYH